MGWLVFEPGGGVGAIDYTCVEVADSWGWGRGTGREHPIGWRVSGLADVLQ